MLFLGKNGTHTYTHTHEHPVIILDVNSDICLQIYVYSESYVVCMCERLSLMHFMFDPGMKVFKNACMSEP